MAGQREVKLSGWKDQEGFLEEAASARDLEGMEAVALAEKRSQGEGSRGRGRSWDSEAPAQVPGHQNHSTGAEPGREGE